jgi:acetyl esterase/lipase
VENIGLPGLIYQAINMKKICCLYLRFSLGVLVAYGPISLWAQSSIPLYVEGHVPDAIPTTVLNDSLHFQLPPDNRDTLVVIPRTLMPTLKAYLPDSLKATGIAVIICSGGAYYKVSDWAEGIPTAQAFAKTGITAFVLHYRVPRSDLMTHKEIVPMEDLQRAIQYVREHAEEYHIDTSGIGVMGYSAGGHLVSTVCTHLNEIYIDNPKSINLRPDFMILAYPVISFADSLTHLVTREKLIGPDIGADRIWEYSNELHVDSQTPPAFIMHSIDDTGVKLANSLYFAAALEANKVPVSLFFYAKGGHGFGVKNPKSSVSWIEPCIAWINERQWERKP